MKPHEKVRDELAEHLVKTRKIHAVMGYGTPEAFKEGFDVGFAYQEARIEKLRAALNFLRRLRQLVAYISKRSYLFCYS